MVRKRRYYLRMQDRGRRRIRRPLPEGMTLAELAAAVGITPRAVRYYFERGVLVAPEFRGTATRYGREHLLRLRAIQALQRQKLDLDSIGKRLAALPAAELEKYAPTPAAPPASAESSATAAQPTRANDLWERVVLLPGLELLVKSDASPLVRKLAREFQDHCLGPAGATRPPP